MRSTSPARSSAPSIRYPALLKQGGGSIIFTASIAGNTVGFPGTAAYAATKAGLIGLTQVLSSEFGPQGVRVNAILPAAIDTPMYRTFNDTEDKQKWLTSLHALKRAGTPEEVAKWGALSGL